MDIGRDIRTYTVEPLWTPPAEPVRTDAPAEAPAAPEETPAVAP